MATETIEKDGYEARISIDEGAPDPRRDCDPFGHMVCFHKRYRLGEKHDLEADDFDGWDAVQEHLEKKLGAVVILPLFLYDHSGLTLKVGSFRGLLPQGHAEFDSGQVGFIYATRKDILDCWNGKRLTKSLLGKAEKLLEDEVDEYSKFLQGDVYEVGIYDTSGEIVDSLGDIYGLAVAREHARLALEAWTKPKVEDYKEVET